MARLRGLSGVPEQALGGVGEAQFLPPWGSFKAQMWANEEGAPPVKAGHS
jgi:hypothetical protein